MSEKKPVSVRLGGADLEFFKSIPGDSDTQRMLKLIRLARQKQVKKPTQDDGELYQKIGSMMAAQESILAEAIRRIVTESVEGFVSSLSENDEKTHDMLRRGLKQLNDLAEERQQHLYTMIAGQGAKK